MTDVIVIMHAGCCRFIDASYFVHGYGASNCVMIREGVFEATVPDRELCNINNDPTIAYCRRVMNFSCV
jgi:hypothetical protein